MNRRDLIGGAAGIGMAATAVAGTLGIVAQAAPSPHPDAGLIPMANRYPAVREAYNSYRGPDDGPENEALWADLVATFTACLDARPTTLEGLAAKVRVSRIDATRPDGSFMEPEQSWSRVAWSVGEDILRLAGGAS